MEAPMPRRKGHKVPTPEQRARRSDYLKRYAKEPPAKAMRATVQGKPRKRIMGVYV